MFCHVKKLFAAALLGMFLFSAPPAASPAAEAGDAAVIFRDQRVEASVREALGKSGGPVTRADMAGLIDLNLTGAVDLTGLDHAVNLRHLVLDNSPVNDFTPVARLAGLQKIILHGRQIKDISGLSVLTGLQSLEIDSTAIKDVAPLAGLINLRSLELWQNRDLSGISPLSTLTGLKHLRLRMNRISDVSPLAGLKNLEQLALDDNLVSDVSPLAGLTGLRQLTMNLNRVGDISALGSLSGLSILELDFNRVEDLSALSGIKNLGHLSIQGNEIRDISPLSGLTRLSHVNLNGNSIEDISPLAAANRNGSLALVQIRGNRLDPAAGSRPAADILSLAGSGAEVISIPQRTSGNMYGYGVTVLVDGELLDFPGQKPFIDNSTGKIFVPVRSVAEALGIKVEWDEKGKTVTLSKGGKKVILSIGSRDFYINGQVAVMESPAALVNDRAVAVLRLFAESFGVDYRWEKTEGGGLLRIKNSVLLKFEPD